MARLFSWISVSSLLALLACGGGAVCSSRSVEDCEDLPTCTLVYGTPLSFPGGGNTGGEPCFESGAQEPLACAPQAEACPPDIKYATSPDGTCYAFGNCVPDGFTDCPDAEGAHECS